VVLNKQRLHARLYWKAYRAIKGVTRAHRGVIYAHQRMRRGWSTRDVGNFDQYLAGVIISGVEHLRKTTHGHPTSLCCDDFSHPDCSGAQLWDDMLATIVDGFTAHREMFEALSYIDMRENRMERFEEGAALFTKHFGSLWD